MAHDDTTDSIIAQFSNINVEYAITDNQLLETLNELRLQESRETLTDLPTQFSELTPLQKKHLHEKLLKDIRIHNVLQEDYRAQHKPYPNIILLNRTEQLLLGTNRQAPTHPQIEYLTYEGVASQDRPLYFPNEEGKDKEVFITDTPTQFINTPSYSTRFDCFVAAHTITTQTHVTPIVSVNQTETTSHSSEESEDILNSTSKDVRKGRRPKPNLSIISTPSSLFGRFKNKLKKMTEQTETQKILDLEKLNATLSGQLETLKTGKQRANTEREDIARIDDKLNNLIKLFETHVTVDMDDSIPKSVDTTVRQYSILHTLPRPENIVKKGTRAQESLSAIKPTTILATVGPFDPETNKTLDFKKFWDRLITYLRDYQLYEHEYVQCLLTLMKGTTADIITEMNKQYKGDLEKILEALQDIFLPQYSIFDDYDELNKFTRPAGEHIRTTVRRASLLIWKLEHTVAPAAWPDRQYYLIVNIIKQVIDKKTFRHLRSKELECSQKNTELSIEAMTEIINLYEISQELIPQHEIAIKFNVNTMQLTDQPDIAKTQYDELQRDIQTIMSTVKSLQPKRHKPDSSSYRETRPSRPQEREILRGRRRLSQDPMTMRSSSQKRTYDESAGTPQAPQRNYGIQDKKPYNQTYQNKSYPSSRPLSRGRDNSRQRSYSRGRDYSRNRSSSYGNRGYTNRSYTPDSRRTVSFKGDRDYKSESKNYQKNKYQANRYGENQRYSKGGNTKYTLNLYQCRICNGKHVRGQSCTYSNQRPNLN